MVRLTDRPDMTLDVYRGRKTTMQQQQQFVSNTPTTGSSIHYRIVLTGKGTPSREATVVFCFCLPSHRGQLLK